LAGVAAQEAGRGNVLCEYWWGGEINGSIDTLTNHPGFPANPGAREWRQSMDRADLPDTDHFGVRIRGYLTPPKTGESTFWMYSDDDGKLWLSSDEDPANSVLIAHVSGWTSPNEWKKYASQKSQSPVKLEAGRWYYVEALYTDGTGAGLVGVRWTGPVIGDTPTVIQGDYLRPFVRVGERQ